MTLWMRNLHCLAGSPLTGSLTRQQPTISPDCHVIWRPAWEVTLFQTVGAFRFPGGVADRLRWAPSRAGLSHSTTHHCGPNIQVPGPLGSTSYKVQFNLRSAEPGHPIPLLSGSMYLRQVIRCSQYRGKRFQKGTKGGGEHGGVLLIELRWKVRLNWLKSCQEMGPWGEPSGLQGDGVEVGAMDRL